MHVLSVNVGPKRRVGSGQRRVITAFVKRPVHGTVAVSRHGLAGDEHGNPELHGDDPRAVYAYPVEHYAFWQETLHRRELPMGSFGENLTVEGWMEEAVRAGDRYRIGSTELEATVPRLPCSTMQLVFDRPAILREFLMSGRTGFLFRVVHEGSITAGDEVSLTHRSNTGPSIEQLIRDAQGSSAPAAPLS